MDKTRWLSLWSCVILLIATESGSSVLADERATNIQTPNIRVVKPQETIQISEAVTLSVIFSWQGNEDLYQFPVPEKIRLKNLKLLRVAQAAEIEGTTFAKKFTFEFEPLGVGKAEIEPFEFQYRIKNEPNSILSHRIDSSTIEVVPIKTPHPATLLVILLAVGLSIIAALFFFVAKRRSKPIQSDKDISLETHGLKALNELSVKIRAETNYTVSLKCLEQVLREYRTNKWGLLTQQGSQENLSKFDQRNLEEANQLLKEIERYQFSGLSISVVQLMTLVGQVKSLIERYQVCELSSTT